MNNLNLNINNKINNQSISLMINNINKIYSLNNKINCNINNKYY